MTEAGIPADVLIVTARQSLAEELSDSCARSQKAARMIGWRVDALAALAEPAGERVGTTLNVVLVDEQPLGELLSLEGFLEFVRRDDLRLSRPLRIVVMVFDGRRAADLLELGADAVVVAPTPAEQVISVALGRGAAEASPSDLTGKFGPLALLDIIQFLSTVRGSGILTISGGWGAASISFRSGQIVHASDSFGDGEPVLVRLVRASIVGDSFAFVNGESGAVKATIHRRTEHLLLSIAGALDETAGG